MGYAYGITETVGGFAVILASPLAGLLYQNDPRLMYIIGFILIIISLIISSRFIPRPEVKT
jgi:MFS family permease